MTLTIDDYLAWTPADMAQGAAWLHRKRNDMAMSATALRNATADGTAGQCGPYIDARRNEANRLAERIEALSESLGRAAEIIDGAGTDLSRLVELLRDDCAVIREEGFERFDGIDVRDTRTSIDDEEVRAARQQRAMDLKVRLSGRVKDIRDRDDEANQDLHALVDRPVRDRTREGNRDPFVTGLSGTSIVTGIADAVAAAAEGKWQEAARNAGRGLVTVWGLGPAGAILGFMGAVADRPEDEPLHEAVVAEGAGTVAAAGAIPLGAAIGGSRFGLPGAIGGGAIGAVAAPYASQLGASKVREWFDHEN